MDRMMIEHAAFRLRVTTNALRSWIRKHKATIKGQPHSYECKRWEFMADHANKLREFIGAAN